MCTLSLQLKAFSITKAQNIPNAGKRVAANISFKSLRSVKDRIIGIAMASNCNTCEICPCAVATVRRLCLALDAISGCLAFSNPNKTQFICLGGRRRLASVDRNRNRKRPGTPPIILAAALRTRSKG